MITRLAVSTVDDKGKGHLFPADRTDMSVPAGHSVTNVREIGTFRLASLLSPEQRNLLNGAVRRNGKRTK